MQTLQTCTHAFLQMVLAFQPFTSHHSAPKRFRNNAHVLPYDESSDGNSNPAGPGMYFSITRCETRPVKSSCLCALGFSTFATVL